MGGVKSVHATGCVAPHYRFLCHCLGVLGLGGMEAEGWTWAWEFSSVGNGGGAPLALGDMGPRVLV